jgi:primosomal protein N' (replication factor Y)
VGYGETMKIARVLITINTGGLDREFDYLIPDHLESGAGIGARVLVPFQNKPAIAFIWEITDHSECARLKEVIQVIDDPPLITRSQYELAAWLAPYYLCNRVDVLKLCIPPGSSLNRRNNYRMAVGEDYLKKTLMEYYPAKIAFSVWERLHKLSRDNSVPDEWEQSWQDHPKIWDWLLRQKLVEKSVTIAPPRIRPKTSRIYHWATEDASKETAAAERVKQILAANRAGLTRTDICSGAQVSPTVVARLIKEGKLTCEVIRAERLPAGLEGCAPQRRVAFTAEQQTIYEQIVQAPPEQPVLLHGVTGSGKTEIYFELAAQTLAAGAQVLYLVPEISLTPQTLARARTRFGDQVALLHSNMSDGERYDQWFKIQNRRAGFVLGARSALFAPFGRLGLIIVDEEHETTYKQEDTPRYHVRKVAEKLAGLTGARLIFGSATPSVETFYRAETGKYSYFKLEQRYNNKPLPQVTLVDMREELRKQNKNVLSKLLFDEIEAALSRREQIILFLNRRGHSTFVLCRDCGQALQCPACEVSLTYHSYDAILRCHYCDHRRQIPDTCPNCHSTRIRYFGNGTQKLEAELAEHFPQARIVRMDMDSTARKGAHQRIYQELTDGTVDILLGTQMVAKGLDLPRVTLVGVISADSALNMPDFRSAERCFQLLTQVAGRAGRGEKTGKVIFQTYNPGHYALNFAQNHDFHGFYQTEIVQRQQLDYPPFAELVKVVFSGPDEGKVQTAAGEFARILQEKSSVNPAAGYEVLGPAPAVIAKIQNSYRWQLMIKAKNPHDLERFIQDSWQTYPYRKFPDVRVVRDRNPY